MRMDIGALDDFLAREFPQVAEEFAIERSDPDGLTLRLDAGPRHLRPGGTVSGPTLFALADVGVYLAILARIGPAALAVTTNCSIDFLRRPEAEAPLRADVRILKLGRRLAVGDALIRSQASEGPVARASLTYSIPPGR